ncbi:MAG TPA: patatin-like phospholipase family protein [Thermoanaerobaculia bacterium]
MAENPLPLSEVLREEFVRLHGPLPEDVADRLAEANDEKRRLQLIYEAIHRLAKDPDTARTALCLSGGGIRSATFGLGVLQGLASFKLLSKFDFLSTVSGGGYMGGWLSSFVRRSPGGVKEVESGIHDLPDKDPIAPEIEPLTWLRRFSNYLTPKLGLLSGDTWAFTGSYLRNLLLGWLIFIPFLAALLALPRLAVALLRWDLVKTAPDFFAVAAGLLIALSAAVLAQARPVSYRDRGWMTNGRFQRWILLPYLLAAVLLVVYWTAVKQGGLTEARWPYAFAGLIAANTLPAIWYMLRFFVELRRRRQNNVRRDSNQRRYALKKFAFEVVGALISGVVAAGLLFAVTQLFPDPLGTVTLPKLADWQSIPPSLTRAPSEVFLCFAVPLVLAVLFVQASIFVGISNWYNEEYDREWWGRAGGWVLLAGLLWIVITAITIYGPVAIYFAPKIYAAVATGSGLVAVLLGKSGLSGASARDKNEKSTTVETGTNITLALAGPLFAVAILALISLITSAVLFQTRPRCTEALMWKGVRCVPASEPDLATRLAGTYEVRESTPIPKTNRTREFVTSRWAAADSATISATQHLWVVDTTTMGEGLLLVIGLGAFAWIFSYFIGANQFSMHGLYRNRLIRAYLGASRTEHDRQPNCFTGFDPTDNLAMDLMRPEAFWPSTFRNVVRDGPKIVEDDTLLSIEQRTKDAVQEAQDHPSDPERVHLAAELLAADLNRAIRGRQLVRPGGLPQPVLNRLALEERYPGAFHPMENHKRPMHVVGMTLNLVQGDNLAWQERKAEPFSVTPLHAGTFRVGYRPTAHYGGPAGVSLGTAVAISGAAANPNMGYSSSPALAFLLTLFNVRLGWWWGNPKKETYSERNPRNTLRTVLDEMFGITNADNDWINLSDGGHFENLGVYEMVLRRCHCIVVSDGSADPDFGFGDFGNAIRKIRIDLGINIKITHMHLFPRSRKDPQTPKYCAVADIYYSDVDGKDAPVGKLLYLKPAFYGEKEPKDVYNYAATYETFPHQSTGDQWYSESQFESYRQLGFFSMTESANGRKTFNNVPELIAEAEKYVAPPPKHGGAGG